MLGRAPADKVVVDVGVIFPCPDLHLRQFLRGDFLGVDRDAWQTEWTHFAAFELGLPGAFFVHSLTFLTRALRSKNFSITVLALTS